MISKLNNEIQNNNKNIDLLKKEKELLRSTIEEYIRTPHNESFKINEEIDPL